MITVLGVDGKKRCFGGQAGKELYTLYHDQEWGIPVHEDQRLFEMLILEGAQSGLSWETILNKREAYRHAFHQFDPIKVAQMSDDQLEQLLQQDSRIIRNRRKVYATRQNARCFLLIQKEYGSFDRFVWGYVDHCPRVNRRLKSSLVPSSSKESEALSRELKARGMLFVGPIVIYSFMQAVGMVCDHCVDCWRCPP